MPCSSGTQKQADFSKVGSPAANEPRQRGPLGEGLTDAELEPIRVHEKRGGWQVDYGSYAQGYHASREEAIETAMTAAVWENRELLIDRPRSIDPNRAGVVAYG